MIPFRDENPSSTTPYVTRALVALNVVLFAYELWLGQALPGFIQRAAVVPELYTGADLAFQPVDLAKTFAPDLLSRFIVAMFLHGGFMHLIGNMLYLWIFGDNVEDRLGHVKFLFFYLVAGGVASWAHIASDPGSKIPSLGASGAIAGVLGVYLVLYPRARVLALLPLGFFSQLVKIPALWFLGFWFLQQSFSGVWDLRARTAQTGGVAWWAHIGGFVVGVLVGAVLKAFSPQAPVYRNRR